MTVVRDTKVWGGDGEARKWGGGEGEGGEGGKVAGKEGVEDEGKVRSEVGEKKFFFNDTATTEIYTL